MVTPEMLLFLAGKMGLPSPRMSVLCGVEFLMRGGLHEPDWYDNYCPHKGDAQFGRLVVWAWQQGLALDNCDGSIVAQSSKWRWRAAEHADTPDSIRAAAVVAICRALGWEG